MKNMAAAWAWLCAPQAIFPKDWAATLSEVKILRRDITQARRKADARVDALDGAKREIGVMRGIIASMKAERDALVAQLAEAKSDRVQGESTIQSLRSVINHQGDELESLRKKRHVDLADGAAVGWISKAEAQAIEVLRVRSTLEFYADPKNYMEPEVDHRESPEPSPIEHDKGQKARDALADFLA